MPGWTDTAFALWRTTRDFVARRLGISKSVAGFMVGLMIALAVFAYLEGRRQYDNYAELFTETRQHGADLADIKNTLAEVNKQTKHTEQLREQEASAIVDIRERVARIEGRVGLPGEQHSEASSQHAVAVAAQAALNDPELSRYYHYPVGSTEATQPSQAVTVPSPKPKRKRHHHKVTHDRVEQ